MTIINLNDHRPHFVIHSLDGAVRVVPAALLLDYVSGKILYQNMEEADPMLRGIVAAFLSSHGIEVPNFSYEVKS